MSKPVRRSPRMLLLNKKHNLRSSPKFKTSVTEKVKTRLKDSLGISKNRNVEIFTQSKVIPGVKPTNVVKEDQMCLQGSTLSDDSDSESGSEPLKPSPGRHGSIRRITDELLSDQEEGKDSDLKTEQILHKDISHEEMTPAYDDNVERTKDEDELKGDNTVTENVKG